MKNIKVTLTFNKKAQSRDELGDILVSFDWKGEHYDWELMEQLSYSAYKMMIWLDDSSDELDWYIDDAGMDEKPLKQPLGIRLRLMQCRPGGHLTLELCLLLIIIK